MTTSNSSNTDLVVGYNVVVNGVIINVVLDIVGAFVHVPDVERGFVVREVVQWVFAGVYNIGMKTTWR